jgi:histidinol-phosphate/aromatic aminotransferase/cobyric acid decarboxylase-like protein
MTPHRNNVISIIGVRAVLAALEMGPKLIDDRRSRIALIRADLTRWCRKKKLEYIEPHGNFIMIDTGRDVTKVSAELVAKRVVPGRPFPSCDTMLRVTIGSENSMVKFKTALSEVLGV